METEFYLPKVLREHEYDKVNKIGVEIKFEDFRYMEGMIPVDYIYELDNFDVNYLLKLIADKYNIKSNDGINIFNFLLELENNDEDNLYGNLIYDYIDNFHNNHSDVINKLKEYVKNKAYEEFKKSFDFFVYPEDYNEYLEVEEYE